MLLCADILTLCFVGWVILIWNRCFFTCWFESTAKGKSWEFSGIFCESGPPCHGCLKQKSQTPTYDANQGSYFGGTQSPCRSPGSCGSSEREATLKTKPFLSFFFFCVCLGLQTGTRIHKSESFPDRCFLVCLLSFLLELWGEAMMATMIFVA